MGRSDSQVGAHRVVSLSVDQADEAVAVLCESFQVYPVMQYVIRAEGVDYTEHLRTLIAYFVMARFWREEPVLAVIDGDEVVATAIVLLPGDRDVPAVVNERREEVWSELGEAARARYELYGETCQKIAIDRPNCHLSMIGVRETHLGMGLARRMLDAVHEISRRDPVSDGVTLTTEVSSNVAFYEHFGYEVLGHVRVSDELESWGFFRADDASG